MDKYKELFTRYKGNPIIKASNLAYQANSVFNAAATLVGDETLLLMRVEDRRGISHLTIARSKDGIENWVIDDHPSFTPYPEEYPEDLWGIEDPRITRIDALNLWVITYTSYSISGPVVSMATTQDFESFDRKGIIMPPEDKDAAIFPIQFNNRWAMLHRPATNDLRLGAHIWIVFSPDMKHWGDHQILIPARMGSWWDANKVGISTPPLQTEKGWLLLYHGVKQTASGSIYRLGLALLDLADPTKVLARTNEWMFTPEAPYEVVGDVDKVVFPCGWVVHGEEVYIYYGAADTSIALATAKIQDLLDFVMETPQVKKK